MASATVTARRGHVDGVVAEVGQRERPQQRAAVGVGARAHPALAPRRELGQLLDQAAVRVEQLLRAGTSASTTRAVRGARGCRRARRAAPGASGTVPRSGSPSTSFGPVQPFGVRSTIIGHSGRVVERPARAAPRIAAISSSASSSAAAMRAVHRAGVGALDEDRPVAVPLEEGRQLLRGDPGEDRGVGDLVAVQVQDRQHRPVAHRIEELVGVPARGERSGLGLAVADDAADHQIRVVERGAVGVRQRVAELAALVDRPRRLRRDVARDAARERELAEEPAHALDVLTDLGVDLGVGPLEVGVGDDRRAAVARAGDVERLEVARG